VLQVHHAGGPHALAGWSSCGGLVGEADGRAVLVGRQDLGRAGSRSATNSRHSVLLFGGPTSSMPWVRAAMSSAPLKADSAPNEPALAERQQDRPRRCGSADHAA
jgi:hypothetical protein